MANFVGDLSGSYIVTPTLYGTTTGVTTDGDATGASVDLAGNVANIVTAVCVVGKVTGTTPTWSPKMQESTDGSNNWTDVTGGAFTQFTTPTNQVQVIAFKPTKRYVRSTGTTGGTSPVFPATITVVAPLRMAPSNSGGFNLTAAPGN